MAQAAGKGIEFPSDHCRARQKLFRYLDNRFDSEQYRENIRKLTPAIIAVLPLEYRRRLIGTNCKNSRLAEAEKEVAEAKQAILLDAPEHQKLKELSEGIASLFRLMPEQLGPLMTMVTTMLGQCEDFGKAKAAVLEHQRLSVAKTECNCGAKYVKHS